MTASTPETRSPDAAPRSRPARPDVLVHVEDVVGVDACLEVGQAAPFRVGVRAPYARLALVVERVHVDARRERLHRLAVGPGDGELRLVVGGVVPGGAAAPLDQRRPMAEGRVVLVDLRDRAAVALERAVETGGF